MVVGHPTVASHSRPLIGQNGHAPTLHSMVEQGCPVTASPQVWALPPPPYFSAARSVAPPIQVATESGQMWTVEQFRSGDPLFTFDSKLQVVLWNGAAEQLAGIPATGAIGRPCWHVLCGVDDGGRAVCHQGCSSARLACEGWPVTCQYLTVSTARGGRRVAISTIARKSDGEPAFVHLMRDAEDAPGPESTTPRAPSPPTLTPRRREVLTLLAEGCRRRRSHAVSASPRRPPATTSKRDATGSSEHRIRLLPGSAGGRCHRPAGLGKTDHDPPGDGASNGPVTATGAAVRWFGSTPGARTPALVTARAGRVRSARRPPSDTCAAPQSSP